MPRPSLDKIKLLNMEFNVCHGVYESEWQQPQPFIVSVEVAFDAKNAGQSDDLDLALDYTKIYALVAKIMTGEHHDLLESLAEQIAQTILRDLPVPEVRVKLEKPQASLTGGGHIHAVVEIVRSR